MHVGTESDLGDLMNLDDQDAEAVFIHEFTHFIQDLTTTYGLFNTYVVGEYMRMANKDIINEDPGYFEVPIQPIYAGEDNVYANNELARLMSGSGHDDEATLTDHQLRRENIDTINGPLPVDIVEIEYSDQNGNIDTFDFGELCISENMAFIVERECYPDCEPSPDLPYRSAELLVELLYPDFGLKILNVLALCDISLLFQNPGKFFYDTLRAFQNGQRTFKTPEEIYDLCFNNPPTFQQQNFNSIEDQTRWFETLAHDHMTTYLQDPYFNPFNTWTSKMIRNSVNYRFENRYFILDIARGGRIATNEGFISFYAAVGSPLVTNTFGATSLHNPNHVENMDYSLILAIDQINSALFWNQENCELVGICAPNVDRRCAKEPWLRSSDDQLCPYGLVWHHWGLTGYTPN